MAAPQLTRWLSACLVSLTGLAQAAGYVDLPGGVLRTALPTDGPTVTVATFSLRQQPVTNAQFALFLARHPQWRRDQVARLFAGERYLANWPDPAHYPAGAAQAPVIDVSWYAARAYCASENARLPSWYEWEFAAAANATRPDARDDPAWRAHILEWYAHPANAPLANVGQDQPDVYGVYDLHGLIWEWVEDYNGLFVTADSRSQGQQGLLEACGAAALSLGDRDNYAVLMRIALLSSLKGPDALPSLGFRCARDIKEPPHDLP
ncbi:formylglycine-generating enzyme required for sulfatase activity [Silvimonas terrae]|uniref:Formylglycine-generating enzyme required for sulfatase activity n=1 Tax=Silvimonas terrae TaxID=300266 RepID=A0A840RJK0_9NEIS|nr:formylglycine-generating enzyme family protein [Silvimonas terrae]MBB5192764.1 formylglycine-generating enzyme required for sulfatase activity [Silvimonas terrae]